MGLALTSGRVDAAFFSEPALSLVRNDLRVLGDPYGAIAPQFITGSYFTTRTYAAAQTAVVANVGRALRQAATWANGHPNDTATILARIQKLDVERVETMARSIYAEALRPSDLQPVFDVAFKYGYLPNANQREGDDPLSGAPSVAIPRSSPRPGPDWLTPLPRASPGRKRRASTSPPFSS